MMRQFYIPKESVKVADRRSDAVAYLHTDPRGRPCAAIFYGKQAKPVFNYAYSNETARETAVRQAFAGRQAHLDRIAAGRLHRSPTAKRNAAAKKVLLAAYGQGSVSVKGGTGTSSGWLHVRFTKPLSEDESRQDRRSEVIRLLREADIDLGYYDTADYGSGPEISVSWPN